MQRIRLTTKEQRRPIHEVLYQNVELVESESSEPQLTKIVAVVSEADSVNRNGRVYPLKVWENNISRMNQNLNERPGAAFHPTGETEIPDVAILWTDVWLEGKVVKAKGNIIPTHVGQDVEACIRAGLKVGISSRGYGSSKEGQWNGNPAMIIQEDYECETFDCVITPSSQNAGIYAYESKLHDIDVESLVNALINLSDDEYNAVLDEFFEGMLGEAKWSTADKNDLPDSCFALVHKPVQDKSKDRALPYKSADGTVDPAHVRNALARLDQVRGFSDKEKSAARKKLQAALKSVGGDPDEEDEQMDKEAMGELIRAAAKVDEQATEPVVEDTKTEQPQVDEKKKTPTEVADLAADAKNMKDYDGDDDADGNDIKPEHPQDLTKKKKKSSAKEADEVDNKQHLDDAVSALAGAVNREVSNGNYYDAAQLAHMSGHVALMRDSDYNEKFDRIKNFVVESSTKLSESDKKIESLTEHLKLVESERDSLRKRNSLIEKMIEVSQPERFSFATLVHLMENVTDESQLESKVTEARKVVTLALKESNTGPTGSSQVDSEAKKEGLHEDKRYEAVDEIFDAMLPRRR